MPLRLNWAWQDLMWVVLQMVGRMEMQLALVHIVLQWGAWIWNKPCLLMAQGLHLVLNPLLDHRLQVVLQWHQNRILLD